MTDNEDFYEILNLEPDCTEKQIKKSYRKLAMKFHPDLNPESVDESTVKFSLIQQAYETLMDPNERAWYDEHRNQPDELEESEMINLRKYMFNDQLYDLDENDNHPFSFYNVIGEVYERLIEEEFKYGIELLVSSSSKKKTKPQRKGKSKKRKNRRRGKGSHNSPSTPLDEKNVRKDDFPRFGNSKTGKKKLKQFYEFWGVRFKTKKTFIWRDKYQTKDGKNRDMRKAIIKSNEKVRKQEKMKYNKLVKSFTGYIKKRDPRWKTFRKRKVEMKRQKLEKEELLKEILRLEQQQQQKQHSTSSSEEERRRRRSYSNDDDDEEEEEEEDDDYGYDDDDDELDSFFDAMDSKKKRKKEPRKEQKNIYQGSTRKRERKNKQQQEQQQRGKNKNNKKKKFENNNSNNNKTSEEGEDDDDDDDGPPGLMNEHGEEEIDQKEDDDDDDKEDLLFGGNPTKNLSKREKRKLKAKQKKKEKQQNENNNRNINDDDDDQDLIEEKEQLKKQEKVYYRGKKKKFRCKKCEKSFNSRSKLFKHLRESGHAVSV